MKAIVASELVIVLALFGCLYMLWLHDEQMRQLEQDYDRLRAAVSDLAKPPTTSKPRASRATKPKETE